MVNFYLNKKWSKKDTIYIDKMLEKSIMELKFILSTAKLTAQEDKEIRAELSQLESAKKDADMIKRYMTPGISQYGSYFSSGVNDLK